MNITRVARYASALVCVLAGASMAFFAFLMLALSLVGGIGGLANGPTNITPDSILSSARSLARFVGPTTVIAVVLLMAAHFLIPPDKRGQVTAAQWR